MEQTESRLAPSPEPASDDSASSLHSASGPADRLAFEPVPLRYREDGLTPQKQRAYVEALADCGVAREAAARIGLSEQAINRVRRRADARSFDNACEAAHLFGARRLRSIAYERAVEGRLKRHFYRGELIDEERIHDNRLLIHLLSRTEHLIARGEPKSRVICDNWEAHMDALELGLEEPDLRPPAPVPPEPTGYEIWKDDEGVWWTRFPPPAGFDGEEKSRFGEDYYERTLSAEEQEVVDTDLAESDAEYRARETARRDRYFGFAGGGDFSPREAETYETSDPPDPEQGPIEYKSASLFRPAALATRRAGLGVRSAAPGHGVAAGLDPLGFAPAAAGRDVDPASSKLNGKRIALRASAPPREPISKPRTFPRRRALPR